MSDLVIGEGVALDLRLAKLPSRALARLLDLLVQVGLLAVFAMVLGLVSIVMDDALTAGLSIVMSVAILVGYPALLETVNRGRTLGKMALGLRVVRADGGPVKFRHALVRALTGVFDIYATAGVLAVVTSFCSRQGRRTGDWLAGTVVVRDRAPDAGVSVAGMAALAMPYPLLGWAQSLDLSALPDDVALAARQYLTRMHEMRPDVAARMGHELASEVLRYVVLPPEGTPPWAYLAAITAERRVRQLRAMEAERRAVWERSQAQYPAYAGAPGPAAGAPPAPAWQRPAEPRAEQPSTPPPVPDRVPESRATPAPGEEGFKPPQ
ncbi:MAG: RDD family protein [Catenulispora sp.]